MSVASIVSENVTAIQGWRSESESWDSIATRLVTLTGEEVSVSSLKVAFSRLTRSSETPAPVEKASKPRAAVRPAEVVKTAVKSDQSDGLRVALTEAEERVSRALSERDSAMAAAAKMQGDGDRLMREIERLKSEVAANKEAALVTGRQRPEGKQDEEKDQVIQELRAQLAEARQAVERWEQWGRERGDDAPRSRPILAAAAILIALIIGGGSTHFGSRFLGDHEPVEPIKLASSVPIEPVKPTLSEAEIAPIKVPSKTISDRPAGLPPLPPRPSVEGVLTGRKTISLLD